MALPNYVAPGQSYVTPEMAVSQNAALASGGGPDLTSQLVGNLSGALKGELPVDVKTLLQQEAAQNAVSSGVSGSQFANYQGLRTLGLTSLNRMQGAENSLVNPLLGPRPYYHPPTPVAPLPPREYSGGFESTTPHYNVGPIQSGGGTPGRAPNPTLPDYQQGGARQNYDNVAMELLAKYGSGAGAGGGSSPMGMNAGYSGTPSPVGWGSANAGFGTGGGSTYFGTPEGYDQQQQLEKAQGLAALGYDPEALGYQQPTSNLTYSDQPSPEVLAQQALYE